MNYYVQFDDDTILVKNIDRRKNTAALNGTAVHFDFRHVHGGLYSLIVNQEVFPVHIRETNGRQEIRIGHQIFTGVIEDERQTVFEKLHSRQKTATGISVVKAPMPGMVVRLEVQKGDRVEKGQGLIVIEAMKMENEIKSPVGGTVAEVMVEAHTTVEKDAPLLQVKT